MDMLKDKFILFLFGITLFASGSISIKLNISFFLWVAIFLVVCAFIFKDINPNKLSFAIYPLGLSLFWVLIKMTTTHDGIFVLGSFILPFASILIFFSVKHKLKIAHQCKQILIALFIINAILSIYEYYTHTLLIYPERPGVRNVIWGFRSAALLSHPLQNAMSMSILMGFLLVDKQLKLLTKYIYLILGIIALLCYNARSSILLWGAFIPLFATSVIMDKYYSFKERIITFIFCFIIIAFAAFLILNYGMADRLLGGELMDGSANTRIEIWNIFKKADIEQFMRGFSESELKFMMKDFDFTAVENSFLMIILYEGLIYFALIIPMIFICVKKMLSGYSLFSKVFLSLIFLAYSNVNNSISASYIPFFVFILALIAFNPKHKQKM